MGVVVVIGVGGVGVSFLVCCREGYRCRWINVMCTAKKVLFLKRGCGVCQMLSLDGIAGRLRSFDRT